MGSAGGLGTLAGGALGFALGGPLGAAAGASIGGSLGGGVDNQRATRDAINAQTYGANQANQTIANTYQQQREDLQPWRQAGGAAMSQLASGNVMGNKQFYGDPGYQFRLNEGLKAVNANASARGRLNSGATMKELMRYGQGFASNEYNNAYNREFNRLSGLANMGYGATGQAVQAGSNYGNQVAGVQTGLANANAAARMNQSNNQQQTMGSLMGLGGQVLGGAFQGGYI